AAVELDQADRVEQRGGGPTLVAMGMSCMLHTRMTASTSGSCGRRLKGSTRKITAETRPDDRHAAIWRSPPSSPERRHSTLRPSASSLVCCHRTVHASDESPCAGDGRAKAWRTGD